MNASAFFGAAAFSGAVLMLAFSSARSGPVTPFAEKDGFLQVALDPFARQSHSIRCKAKESTRVIVWGHGNSALAVYVFDVHGNCVARDDEAIGGISDDLALEWYAPTEATYDVEVRNLARKANKAEIAIR